MDRRAGGEEGTPLYYHCPACRGDLDLSQPDPADPGRLLAVCDACRCWYQSTGGDGFWFYVPRPGDYGGLDLIAGPRD